MKIAMFSTKPYDQESFETYNDHPNLNITFLETHLNANTVELTKGFHAVCIFVNDKVDVNVIRQMSDNGIRLIALRCAGFNNVDLQAAKENNIKVVRVPAYSPESVAEHTMALILTLNRKTHKAYNRVREGNFSLNRLIGFNLYQKTVGVIGTGKIGAAFCRILKGFGCNILAFDPYESEQLVKLGVQYHPLSVVLAQSDIVSLHCPLTTNTKHLINQNTIKLMKEGVMLINTSRGALINTADVIEGLIQQKIAYLGIDVYEQEEHLFFEDLSERIIQDDYILRLNSFPNVLITAHQAYFTKEAMQQITTTTLKNIIAFDSGQKLKNEVIAA
ncbi:MAG: 2-hydroxyacid dehydrogenase [Chitinophagales bacterium]